MLERTFAGLAFVALAATACSLDTGPGQPDRLPVTLRVAATPLSPTAQAPESVTVGGHTLVLGQVELVLRDIRLKRTDHAGDCEERADDCEYFSTGPMLLDLPLGGAPEKLVTVEVDTGTYHQVEFRIHKPEDDGGDSAFLAAHPDLKRISVRVSGRYDGRSFVYTSDLNAKQRNDLAPPLVVNTKAAIDITLRVDVARWFVASGRLVDPATAEKGRPNDNLVRDNIRSSFHWFEDRDHDGKDDR